MNGQMSRKCYRVICALVLLGLLGAAPQASSPQAVRAARTFKSYLAIVRKVHPPYPVKPWLPPIDNADGDGNYTVRWGGGARAERFELQERWQGGDWFGAYNGSAREAPLRNRPAGTYSYRCRAWNSLGVSAWSNLRSVVVQGSPPGTISTPSSSSVNAGGKAVVKVVNDCPYVLHLGFTGPEPSTMQLRKCDVCRVYSFIGPFFCPTQNRPIEETRLDPGPYRVFVSVDRPSVRPYVGYWQLLGNRRYFVCFYIVQSWATDEGGPFEQLVAGSCD